VLHADSALTREYSRSAKIPERPDHGSALGSVTTSRGYSGFGERGSEARWSNRIRAPDGCGARAGRHG